MGELITKVYTAEPTLAALHNDREAFVKYVAGPFGSGKSSGCIMDILMRAMRQQPDENGVRKSRWAVVRNTYPELKSTTIKTFQEWIPNAIAPVVYGIPITSKFVQRMADGTSVDLEFVFLALDGPEDASKLLSFELTGVYINEAREISWEIIEALLGRIPRYPKTIKDAEGKTLYGPTEPGFLMDSNPPQTTHWLYEKFDTGATPPHWKKFQQPPAVYKSEITGKWELNPDAENLSHLPDNYYQQQLDASSDDNIRINLGGEFGMSRKGKPVFGKFSTHKHVALEKLNPVRGFPVLMGIDFGLTPALVILQLTHQGVRILDELPASDETLEDFLDQYLAPLILSRYQGYNITACGDPAGRGRSALDKRTSFDVLRSRGIKAFPAYTNDPVQRIDTVNWFLGRDGGFLISPHCTFLRDALGSGYVFKDQRNNKGEVSSVPLKNEYSHIADATQYGCVFAKYGNRQINSRPPPKDPPKAHLFA